MLAHEVADAGVGCSRVGTLRSFRTAHPHREGSAATLSVFRPQDGRPVLNATAVATGCRADDHPGPAVPTFALDDAVLAGPFRQLEPVGPEQGPIPVGFVTKRFHNRSTRDQEPDNGSATVITFLAQALVRIGGIDADLPVDDAGELHHRKRIRPIGSATTLTTAGPQAREAERRP